MCGIFGIIKHGDSSFDTANFRKLMDTLFLLSESRGKDSAGLVLLDDQQIQVCKRPQRARQLIASAQYRELLHSFEQYNANGSQSKHGVVAMGHARMVTNGKKEYHENNQPVIKDGMVCIHNGIIVNDRDLWVKHPELQRTYEVDTEVLLALVNNYMTQGKVLLEAVSLAMQMIQGANSVALLTANQDALVLTTSNGSLYYALSDDEKELIFASEAYILQQVVKQSAITNWFRQADIQQVYPREGYLIRFDNLTPYHFTLDHASALAVDKLPDRTPRMIKDIVSSSALRLDGNVHIVHEDTGRRVYSENDAFIHDLNQHVALLQRCTRCILPETFPFIEFDEDGVCNYCRTYEPIEFKGEEALKELVAPHRRNNGESDVLVPLSGGRDSSFGIHYIKNVLGMNPVAYTYDWGMVTDLARRNISRMCGKLGIEHILISADIKTKRENVRKNVQAWLKKPALGTVPLFMAGDKQFFYYSRMLQQQMGIGITLYSMNPLERTDFKVGLCGINEVGRKQEKHYALAFTDRLHLMAYYGGHFLSNPAYLNSSLFDSLWAFVSYYMISKDYHILYEYLRWDEDMITDTLISEYDWETAPDTASTWRIGDGTASFYNYIYFTAAGFSENDTLRSNQIREGMIDRETALRIAQVDNQPRYESMRWYADTIGFEFEEAIQIINAMPKRYALE